jgi:hypothetical protein
MSKPVRLDIKSHKIREQQQHPTEIPHFLGVLLLSLYEYHKEIQNSKRNRSLYSYAS